MPRPSEHLAGPWAAVLSDKIGYVYPTAALALEALGNGALVDIAIVRRSALPYDESGTGDGLLRRRTVFDVADVAYETPALLMETDNGVSAAARFEQAWAMANGLNQAAFGCHCVLCLSEDDEQAAPSVAPRVAPIDDGGGVL